MAIDSCRGAPLHIPSLNFPTRVDSKKATCL